MTLSINGKTYEAGELIAYVKKLEKENTALRQDWEIMKNTIADYGDFCDKYMRLEKENAELKRADTSKQLTKAKDIMKRLVDLSNSSRSILGNTWHETVREAEDFLNSEVEK